METIKNYLETMFSPLPNNDKVLRAKDELLSMMEDKYNALVEEGLSPEEAVAKVIAEFGSLNEIAADLGIEDAVSQTSNIHRRSVSLDEAKDFLIEHDRSAKKKAIAIGMFIVAFVPLIILSGAAEYNDYSTHTTEILETIGVSIMFLTIAIGVGTLIVENGKMKKWNYLKTEDCQVDYSALSVINDEYQNISGQLTSMLALGVGFCIISFLPTLIISSISGSWFMEDFGAAILFIFVACGVICILLSCDKKGAYKTILNLNDKTSVGGNQFDSQKDESGYSDPIIANVMSVYWETVLCIYLSWSFLTFNWFSTWLIWPIAAIIHGLIKKLFKDEVL